MSDKKNKAEATILEGDEAVALWRSGPDRWNRWVDEHPGATIDFHRIRLWKYWPDLSNNVSFDGYNFGDGLVVFHGADFGDSNVNFRGATFGDGAVMFDYATFGNGDVLFDRAHFGNGNVSFDHAEFGNGPVSFKDATFGVGNVSFYCTIFGTGTVSFSGSTGGKGDFKFSDAVFGDGAVNFDHATFGGGDVIFHRTAFDEVDLSFERTSFGRHLTFLPSRFNGKLINFQEMSVAGTTVIHLPEGSVSISKVDLRGASLAGPLFISGDAPVPPDLRTVRALHQVDITDLEASFRRSWSLVRWPAILSRVANDPDDIARLRRLKEIAESNRDHQAALRFAADENRAKRWIKMPWLASVLDMTFSGVSDYGQSIRRPIIALLFLIPVFAALYVGIAPEALTIGVPTDTLANLGLTLSITNSFPVLPQTLASRGEIVKALFGATPGILAFAIMVTQGLVSFVLIFLVGLGLRNRFRL